MFVTVLKIHKIDISFRKPTESEEMSTFWYCFGLHVKVSFTTIYGTTRALELEFHLD